MGAASLAADAAPAGGAGRRARPFRRPSALPGFPLAFGYTVFYLSLIVLIPRRTVLKRGELHDDVEVREDETRQLK